MTLCHSAENWRSTQTLRFAFRNEDQHLRSCPLIMADRSFHCLGILSQTSIAFTFWFHISVTKALFLTPSFLLLSLKAHCPSKTTECEQAFYTGKWAGNFPPFVHWDHHTALICSHRNTGKRSRRERWPLVQNQALKKCRISQTESQCPV